MLMKFFDWLTTHLPHAIIIIAALVMISIGFFVAFLSGPVTAAVSLNTVALKYLYVVILWLVGAFPIYALATRDVPLFIKASTFLLVMFVFVLVTRLVTIGFLAINWVYLLALCIIIFLSRMVIWWSNR